MLSLNLIIDLQKDPKPLNTSRLLTMSTAEGIFLKTLDDYGIDKKYIISKSLNQNRTDSLKHIYEIGLPADIILSSLIMDFNRKIIPSNGKILSYEKQKGFDLVFKIFSGEKLKLQAYFKRKKELKRPSSEIAFIINNVDELQKEEIHTILHHIYPLSLMLIPSIKNLELSAQILTSGKEFVVLIGDEIIDEKFNLSENYDKATLSKSIGTIISSFKDAEFFMLDYNSQLSKSAVFTFIKSEFEKKNINLFSMADFTELKAESPEEIISLFDFYVENLRSGDKKFYLVSGELFPVIQNRLDAYVKKGNKIIYPSLLKNIKP